MKTFVYIIHIIYTFKNTFIKRITYKFTSQKKKLKTFVAIRPIINTQINLVHSIFELVSFPRKVWKFSLRKKFIKRQRPNRCQLFWSFILRCCLDITLCKSILLQNKKAFARYYVRLEIFDVHPWKNNKSQISENTRHFKKHLTYTWHLATKITFQSQVSGSSLCGSIASY